MERGGSILVNNDNSFLSLHLLPHKNPKKLVWGNYNLVITMASVGLFLTWLGVKRIWKAVKLPFITWKFTFGLKKNTENRHQRLESFEIFSIILLFHLRKKWEFCYFLLKIPQNVRRNLTRINADYYVIVYDKTVNQMLSTIWPEVQLSKTHYCHDTC